MYENPIELLQENEKIMCEFVSRLFQRDLLIHVDDALKLFQEWGATFNHMFPKHFLFANFQCLRCGQCCRDQIGVEAEDIQRWLDAMRIDILACVDCYKRGNLCAIVSNDTLCADCFEARKETVAGGHSMRCPFVRKVRKKPYYYCRIHATRPEGCSGYLCMKSLPVAHLNWSNLEELIARVGLQRYLDLTKDSSAS